MAIIYHVQSTLKNYNPYFLISLFPYTLISLSLFILLLLASCNSPSNTTLVKLWGEAQGTTYSIKYIEKDAVNFQPEIDSILKDIDNSLSTYVPNSIISRVNQADTLFEIDSHFPWVFNKAKEVFQKTNGAFDPTVAPIVNAWGFGYTGNKIADSSIVDSLLQYVDFEAVSLKLNRNKMYRSTMRKDSITNLQIDSRELIKKNPNIQLDFNAIAQGYTVDVLADFLGSKKIDHYMIELGGEIKARGKNQDEKWWKIGIDKPLENSNDREIEAVIELKNKALATSGSYRKFYEKDGIKYSHTINPKTGYPVQHSLLSVTVVANDCMTADAYATAFMVMGMEKARSFLKENKDLDLDVYFIYSTEAGEWATYYSEGLEEVVVEKK